MEKNSLQESRISAEILNVVHAVIVVMDGDGRIRMFNKAAEYLTGYSFEEVKNKYPWDIFILPEEVNGVRNVFARLTSGDFPNTHTNYWVTKDGSHRLIDWSNTAITDQNENITSVIATGIDITERREAEKEIELYQKNLERIVKDRTVELNRVNEHLDKIARIDSTTGIYNRRHFNETLEAELRRSRRMKDQLSLMMCDVDFFKNYNDSYGHIAGDDCLKEIAATLSNSFNRASDLVARYGGEEFAIILPGITSNKALGIAQELIKEIQERRLPYGSSPIGEFVTISIGVATMQSDELTNSTSILSAADKALYQAKESGRNNARQYSAVL